MNRKPLPGKQESFWNVQNNYEPVSSVNTLFTHNLISFFTVSSYLLSQKLTLDKNTAITAVQLFTSQLCSCYEVLLYKIYMLSLKFSRTYVLPYLMQQIN